MAVSKKQREVLDFITSFISEQGYAPSLQEIASHFRLASASTAHHHVTQLEAAGLLRRTPNANRSIDPVRSAAIPPAVELPLAGSIAAGAPIEAIEESATLAVPSVLLGPGGADRELFILKVKGDSMIDEAIRDGDFVIVEKGRHVRDGETVVALLHQREATLKKFYREGAHVRLQPANESFPPILVHASQVEVQGIVIGVMRRL